MGDTRVLAVTLITQDVSLYRCPSQRALCLASAGVVGAGDPLTHQDLPANQPSPSHFARIITRWWDHVNSFPTDFSMGLQAWINMVLVGDQVLGQGSGFVVHDIAGFVVHEATWVISKLFDDMRFSGKKPWATCHSMDLICLSSMN